MFYLNEKLLVRFPTSKHYGTSHAKWFSDEGITFLHTIRGYLIEDEYIMIYSNDFEIPDMNVKIISYLFEFFPTIKWIGLGCEKGKIGEVWQPKLKVTK